MDMNEIIRSMIEESINTMFLEDAFTDELLHGISPDAIIGDRAKAEQFAKQELVHDIPELKYYAFTEYLPISRDVERWSFEAESMNSWIDVVNIDHDVRNGVSRWKFTFSQAEKSMEHMTAEVMYKTPFMDYERMTKEANQNWQKWGG